MPCFLIIGTSWFSERVPYLVSYEEFMPSSVAMFSAWFTFRLRIEPVSTSISPTMSGSTDLMKPMMSGNTSLLPRM